jgi:F0F1-type ATP synthase membrane subunit c/vacuolar-type H+-ATPase subunit K
MIDTTLFIGAGLAIGLAGLWVGIWEGLIAKKSLQIMGKNPEMSWSFLVLTILGIALTESAAIYGLIIALQIMGLDPATVSSWAVIWAGLAVWAAWFGSWVGEWFLVCWAMDAILRNPENKGKIMTYMILFLALVESSAIYWLVVALSLLW